jgi:hypothetical protein
MHADAEFELKVDVPFPLNVTPAGVIEKAGNVGVQRVLTSLMDTLSASIVRDHAGWAKGYVYAGSDDGDEGDDVGLLDSSVPILEAPGKLATV